ncbi:hypothetical protein [Yunchengibacter salinarum]|uniref:hypothetical protein n=1 Tax=Yunchengibacter salinarum TaxID=3133399 RepID=UPI0035B59829
MAQPTLILHPGAPKTGSTSLQHFLHDQRHRLAAAGVHYVPRFFTRGRVDPLHRLFVRLRRESDPAPFQAAIADRVDSLMAAPGCRALLVSNEALIGPPLVYGEGAFFPAADRALGLLAGALGDRPIRLMLTVREFSAFLISYHGQFVRMGGATSLDHYGQWIMPDAFSWAPLVAGLRRHFPAAPLDVVAFEDIMKPDGPDPARILLGPFCPADLPPFRPERYRRNPAMETTLLEAQRRLNGLANRLLGGKRGGDVKRFFRRAVFMPLEHLPRRRAAPRPDPALPLDRAALAAAYERQRAGLVTIGADGVRDGPARMSSGKDQGP